MPASRTKIASSGAQAVSTTRVSAFPLVARYNGRPTTISRRAELQDVLLSIKSAFKELESVNNSQICVLAKLPTFGDEKIQISSETWSDVIGGLREIWIEVIKEVQDEPSVVAKNCIQAESFDSSQRLKSEPKIKIKIEGYFDGQHRSFAFMCKPSMTMEKPMREYARLAGVCLDDCRFRFGNSLIRGWQTMLELNVEDGDVIDVMPVQVGGKPVIYLFPPSQLSEVNVKLCLVPSWSFSALYPSPPKAPMTLPGHESDGQTASWTVSAMPDGTLTDKASNLQVSYLFWEAHTEPPQLASPPNSRPTSPYILPAFDPARACDWLKAESSVVLPTNKLPAYLDSVLKALTLHTEARTSFITYWLPSLLKHSEVAVRFLPQSAYEEAAPLSIEPKPDVVTRVFMIFRGVAEGDNVWDEARKRAYANVDEAWIEAVGVDTGKALDASLFRVLEWGGMEVVNG